MTVCLMRYSFDLSSSTLLTAPDHAQNTTLLRAKMTGVQSNLAKELIAAAQPLSNSPYTLRSAAHIPSKWPFLLGTWIWTLISHMDGPTDVCPLRYDTRCYINVRSKANMSQLNTARNRQLKSVKTEKLKVENRYGQK